MGGLLSRRNGGVQEVEITSSNAYRYPPKTGCYFGSHFIMGGEKFETTQPESYLFGENTDLNFLGNRPVPFPYPPPQAHEPTKTLKSLVNIRKDSIRFIKVMSSDDGGESEEKASHKYNIEFTFDSDVRVAITIYYFATEEVINGTAVYQPRDAAMNSETFHYKRGANQTFSLSTHVIEPAKFSEDEWLYHPDKDIIPIVIQCVVEEEQYAGHSHASYATVEKSSDGAFMLKALKQKQMVDGLYYLLQEIYGIENKSPERQKLDEEFDDNGSECVICMCETRDTLILPCRHLCLCNFCADNLRYQANNCPICRAPFRALLQVRAMRKKVSPAPLPQSDDDAAVSQEGVPAGYEAVPLIEAINGPQNQSNNQPIMPPLNPVMPPDDTTGSSPALKRKHRRSGKASRQCRRAPRNDKPPAAHTQVATEGATATAAVAVTPALSTTEQKQQVAVSDTPDEALAADDIGMIGEKLNEEQESRASDIKLEMDDFTCTQTGNGDEITQLQDFVEPADDVDVNIDDMPSENIATGCTDEEADDDNEIEEATPLCCDVTTDDLKSHLKESQNKHDNGNLEFTDNPLKPNADSSGSSYSSTSSSKGLLDNMPPTVVVNPQPEDCSHA